MCVGEGGAVGIHARTHPPTHTYTLKCIQSSVSCARAVPVRCEPTLCMNGGSCVEDATSAFSCTCFPGYNGTYCELEPGTLLYVTTSYSACVIPVAFSLIILYIFIYLFIYYMYIIILHNKKYNFGRSYNRTICLN